MLSDAEAALSIFFNWMASCPFRMVGVWCRMGPAVKKFYLLS